MKRAGTLLAVLLLASGCKNVAPDIDESAVIVNPDGASRAALQTAVDAALQTNVPLSADALTESSILVIERRIPPSFDGSPAKGRTMEMPIQFHLVRHGSECILVDQRNQSRTVLDNTECVAESAATAN
jgi:hypothetical protein